MAPKDTQPNEAAPALDIPRLAFRRGGRSPTQHRLAPATPEDILRRLRQCQLFAGLADAILAPLATHCQVTSFRAGETLWRRDDAADRVLFIETGLAKTARRNSLGVSHTFGLHGPGDSLGIYALWAGMRYPTDAVALSQGMTALVVEASPILAAARRHRALAERMAAEIGRFTEAFIDKIEIVSAGSIEKRIATLMSMLLERFGAPRAQRADAAPEQARLPIGLTLELVGEIVDARIETVARVFGAWKRAGWLGMDAGGWDFKRLAALRAVLAVP
jgi:CRP/FNR family transcriptional regulator